MRALRLARTLRGVRIIRVFRYFSVPRRFFWCRGSGEGKGFWGVQLSFIAKIGDANQALRGLILSIFSTMGSLLQLGEQDFNGATEVNRELP